MSIHPFHLVLSALAHWLNRKQAAIIDYLRVENRVHRYRLGPKRLRFTGAGRRRLAAKAKRIYRSVLPEIARNTTGAMSGFLFDKRYLITDRDPRFTKEFRAIPDGPLLGRTAPGRRVRLRRTLPSRAQSSGAGEQTDRTANGNAGQRRKGRPRIEARRAARSLQESRMSLVQVLQHSFRQGFYVDIARDLTEPWAANQGSAD